MGIFDTFKLMLTPSGVKTFIDERTGKENWVDALKNYLIADGINFLFSAILVVFLSVFSGFIAGLAGGVFKGATNFGTNLASSFINLAINFVIFVPLMVFGEGVLFILAKLFGGKSSFTKQVYFGSYLHSVFVILTTILAFIPCVGLIIYPLYLYEVYLHYVRIKKIHELDTLRAALVILIPLLISLMLLVFFLLVVGAGVLAGLSGLSGVMRR